MKVFITRKIPSGAVKLLTAAGFAVDVFEEDRGITKSEILERGKTADALLTLLTDKIDREVIDGLANLKIISNYAVGYNNIDVKYANSKNIIVTNTPDILTHATAEIAVGLILSCARKLYDAEKFVRERKFVGWKPELFLGTEIHGKTVGVVGAGRIGYETAKIMKAFGARIVYFNRSEKPEFENELGAKKVSFKELLKDSDIVTFHVPLTEETYHMLNTETMRYLKTDAIVINTARGEVIDEIALLKRLKTGKLKCAGFDVFENEPNLREELFNTPNVVLLPHIGSATTEARGKMAELCAENIISVLNGKFAVTPVL